MEEALRAWLLANAPLAALVGDRVNWGLRPQGEPVPSVALHLIDALPTMNLAEPGVWQNGRIQVDCRGDTFKVARDVANVIGARVSDGGAHGLRDTLSGIKFRIFVLARDSDFENVGSGVLHRTRLDLNTWWQY